MQINIHTDWLKVLQQEINKPYWSKLDSLVTQAYSKNVVYPSQNNIFKCFDCFNINNTKVVVIGQDPYYLPNQANGLCFGVNTNVALPKSLINIFQELKDDLHITRTNGDLSNWAKQGILLLNNTLTVEQFKPNSHRDFGWTIFTDNIIKWISDNLDHVIFVLWGNFAQSKLPLINTTKHYAIKSAHPSPLSAYNGFFGSKPFSKINNYLISNNKTPIDWE